MRILVYLFAAAMLLAMDDPVRRIEDRFLAPCCWRESVAVHQSPKAEELRTEIRQMVAAGKTEPEIVESLVKQYGERILREPRGRLSLWLMLAPLVVLVGGGTALTLYLRRAKHQIDEEPQPLRPGDRVHTGEDEDAAP